MTPRPLAPARRALGACALVAAGCLAVRGAHAQGTPPAAGPAAADSTRRVTLQGVAWDSLSAAPLAGAVVQLVSERDPSGSARTATADSLGRWQIDSLLPAMYVVGYFHPTLDALGLEAPSYRVQVQGDSVARLDFAIPGPARMRTMLCGAKAPGDSTGGIVGMLRDADSELPVSGAAVSVSWRELVIERGAVRMVSRRVPVAARPDGIFAACGVPTDTPVEIDAGAPGLTTGIVEVQVPLGQMVRRDLVLGDSATIVRTTHATAAARSDSVRGDAVVRVPGGAEVRGTVRGPDGRPMARAQVAVAGTGRTATTGEGGTFAIDALPSGSFGLDVRALGYAPVRLAVDLLKRRPATVTVTLRERATTLSSVLVHGKRSRSTQFLEEFAQRKRRSVGGTFLGPLDIEKRNALYVSDVLRTTPGLHLAPARGFGYVVRGRGECTPAIFLDGMPVYNGADELDEIVRPSEVMAIEVYNALGALPVEYAGLQSNGCGAIAVWTKR